MKALFRADASSNLGNGHVARCLTLARALQSRGASTVLATSMPSPHVRAWTARENADLVEVDSTNDRDDTIRHATGAAIVVLDGYHFAPGYEDALRGKGRVVCILDDLASRPLRGDVVLNGNFYAEELAYDVGEHTRLLLGPTYALIRDEFVAARELREAPRQIEAARPRIFVTMGGADPTAETEKFLVALELLEPANVRIAVGGADPRAETISAQASRLTRHHIEVLVDARNMGTHMAWCDVALSAAGSTCLELACVGVPAGVIVVADNQRGTGTAVDRWGLMHSLGHSDSVDPEQIARFLNWLLKDESWGRSMVAAQRARVDGLGKARIADALMDVASRL